jgi:hypothetical protein
MGAENDSPQLGFDRIFQLAQQQRLTVEERQLLSTK